MSDKTSIKLLYFDAYGRGEVIRMILALSGEEYVDERVTWKKWYEGGVKYTTPFGHCPVLHIGNFQLSDSGAIIRFLSNKYNLNGKNNLEAAKIEMMYQQIRDDWGKLPFFEKDLKVKEEKTESIYNDHILPTLKKVDEIAKSNHTKFLVTDEITYADLLLAHTFCLIEKYKQGLTKQFKNLTVISDRVKSHAVIKKYLEERPYHDF